MTRRERLADWISGGTVTFWYELYSQAHSNAAFQLEQATTFAVERELALEALEAIEAATRDGKSGTARKINRMAREALK